MSLCEFSDRARRRRATVNLSRVLGCHRTTYNRRWNKLRTDFLRRHDLLSFCNFANESTTTVDRENNCHEIPSTVLPSTSCTNERLLEDNECSTVDLPCQKPLSRKEKINRILMHLMTSTYLSIRDADRVLNEFRLIVPDLPTSIRSILRTCTSVQPKSISSGVYYHLGLKTSLLRYVELWLCTCDFDSLQLYINVDGLSMSRSSSQHLWPVLGRIVAPRLSDVFMIGIYGGNTKPAQFNEISADTISEIKEMTETGLLSVRFNKYIAIKLSAVICDAPARSDVRYTVNHNAKVGCDRCVVNGRRLDGTMTFPNGEYTLRTDDTFRNQTQYIHHKGHSLFESLPIDMILTFPLDPMHMVYLGVTKKLVTLWIELGHKRLKNMNSCVIRTINKLISRCVESTPSDFPRKCRTLDYLSVWKATECRLFLLYLGPVILQNILPKPLYINFKCLALSMYLLAHPKFYNRVTESDRMDLRNFLREYEWCYRNMRDKVQKRHRRNKEHEQSFVIKDITVSPALSTLLCKTSFLDSITFFFITF
ncbi:unnamed protein product [Schistosoma rodhaini]|uniref:Transposase domain-containing protein n=1 Tax=Schistosoma rodhaini TaxID=6188 RepID=A0AA85FZE6_9TREM|nr:unnamed protein product [Schistosoma rodhaini]